MLSYCGAQIRCPRSLQGRRRTGRQDRRRLRQLADLQRSRIADPCRQEEAISAASQFSLTGPPEPVQAARFTHTSGAWEAATSLRGGADAAEAGDASTSSPASTAATNAASGAARTASRCSGRPGCGRFLSGVAVRPFGSPGPCWGSGGDGRHTVVKESLFAFVIRDCSPSERVVFGCFCVAHPRRSTEHRMSSNGADERVQDDALTTCREESHRRGGERRLGLPCVRDDGPSHADRRGRTGSS